MGFLLDAYDRVDYGGSRLLVWSLNVSYQITIVSIDLPAPSACVKFKKPLTLAVNILSIHHIYYPYHVVLGTPFEPLLASEFNIKLLSKQQSPCGNCI